MTSDAVRRIKESVDLAALVGEYIQLKPMAGRMVGLCCFHKEKTPSFGVHPSGFWYCFGCQLGGDAIDFIARIEGVTKGRAIRMLSERTGIVLTGRPQTRAQRAYGAEEMAFCAWWKQRQCSLLASRLGAYVRCLDVASTEEECEAAGLLWRQVAAAKGEELRALVARCSTAEDRRLWNDSKLRAQHRLAMWSRCIEEIERCKTYVGPRDLDALLGWADWEAELWLIEREITLGEIAA